MIFETFRPIVSYARDVALFIIQKRLSLLTSIYTHLLRVYFVDILCFPWGWAIPRSGSSCQQCDWKRNVKTHSWPPPSDLLASSSCRTMRPTGRPVWWGWRRSTCRMMLVAGWEMRDRSFNQLLHNSPSCTPKLRELYVLVGFMQISASGMLTTLKSVAEGKDRQVPSQTWNDFKKGDRNVGNTVSTR